MIGALSEFTSYDRVVRFGRELTSRDVVREAYAIATRVIANATEAIKSPEALFYLACKAIFRKYAKPKGQTALVGVSGEPIVLSSQDVITLSYGFLRTGSEKEEKLGVRIFTEAKIIEPIKRVKGAKVAQQKVFRLLEPLGSSLSDVKELLGARGVDPVKLTAGKRSLNTVDVLHILEYYARQGRAEFSKAYSELYARCPSLVREAVECARVISGFTGDPEFYLAKLVVDYVERG